MLLKDIFGPSILNGSFWNSEKTIHLMIKMNYAAMKEEFEKQLKETREQKEKGIDGSTRRRN